MAPQPIRLILFYTFYTIVDTSDDEQMCDRRGVYKDIFHTRFRVS